VPDVVNARVRHPMRRLLFCHPLRRSLSLQASARTCIAGSQAVIVGDELRSAIAQTSASAFTVSVLLNLRGCISENQNSGKFLPGKGWFFKHGVQSFRFNAVSVAAGWLEPTRRRDSKNISPETQSFST
jgi:hypothetical protein